jgi:hypothetical protein
MLRQELARAARSAAPCDECGHPHREHRELRPTFELRDGEIVEVPDPEYRPGEFHCHADGCDCVVTA